MSAVKFDYAGLRVGTLAGSTMFVLVPRVVAHFWRGEKGAIHHEKAFVAADAHSRDCTKNSWNLADL
jgi:hypothetical protein